MNGVSSGDWIDRGSRLLLQLGVPTVFAVVLLWFVLTRFSAALDQVVGEMHQQTVILVEIQTHVIERDKRLFNYEWQHQQQEQRQHSLEGER